MIYARIQDGLVAELVSTDGDIATMFHPSLVFAAVNGDVPEIGYLATVSNGAWSFQKPVPPAPTFEQYISEVANGVSSWLSAYVHETYGYDDIVSAASYAGDKNPRFSAEGTAARDWRSDCFIALYAAMPQYADMSPDQWPELSYITSNLPQPSAYAWEPADG